AVNAVGAVERSGGDGAGTGRVSRSTRIEIELRHVEAPRGRREYVAWSTPKRGSYGARAEERRLRRSARPRGGERSEGESGDDRGSRGQRWHATEHPWRVRECGHRGVDSRLPGLPVIQITPHMRVLVAIAPVDFRC